VVFTSPDGAAVNCLTQREGSLAWKVDRQDDRYLAGVYDNHVLLVGEHRCRALDLKDGKELWRVETGQPSGRGVANKNVYYLPLAVGAATGKPEVLTIDIATGRTLTHLPTSNGETPGNLLIQANQLISQTATEVTAYPFPSLGLLKTSPKP
jgi:outer membrane protein assembly factor BamB